MASLDDFVDHVRPYLQGCPTATLRRVVIEVLRDLCHRCPVWIADDVIATAAGLSEYQVNPPDGAEVVKVRSIKRYGASVEIPNGAPGGESHGPVQRWNQPKPGSIAVWPTPSVEMDTQLLALDVQCKPVIRVADVREIPEQTFSETVELVGYGVQGRVYKMPGKWSDPSSGEHFRRLYESELDYKKMLLREHTNTSNMQLSGSPLA